MLAEGSGWSFLTQRPLGSGAALGEQLAAKPGASVVCNLYVICSSTLKRKLVLGVIVQTESNSHFSHFLSLHRVPSLSLQRAFICCASGTAEEGSAEEDALLLHVVSSQQWVLSSPAPSTAPVVTRRCQLDNLGFAQEVLQ